ncbi:Rho-binding antiterminator [Cellvibrio fibrivorans]|uniref:Rho-binding antiterminator n=1 Tax=Cellvibrio fibrivorans TaxID=126350 RepID=A0ABU1V337_9GAMM|nr:Rho-binding antiterminator [Cellvibrio fibrivorans]MDR7091878.1 Rho-binding antiterminator [Cellvibrio fibrivorans]
MISCNQHDYIEIVCMYHYPIKLTLKSGDIIHGIAQDTQRNDNRDECIKIDIDGVEQLVVLEEIKMLEVMMENTHLQKVTF